MSRSRQSILAASAATLALLLSACTDSAGTSAESPASTDATAADAVTVDGISDERCAANTEAGTITYLSGFDFAATASIVDVVVAEDKGYYDKMCLDVEIKPSFSSANYPIVGANTAQFSSAGSYAEVLTKNVDGAEFVVVAIEGKIGIDALLVRPDDGVDTPVDLKGRVIGVKGALPPSQVAMLNKYGLQQGSDYEEVSLEGFDPTQHWAQPIDALPVFKSNEPGILDVAGIGYTMFDPAEEGIPGNFGLIYTNREFADAHPTAVQDFVRATMMGLADAIDNPDEAVDLAFAKITDGGNQNFLSKDGESFRWGIEADILVENTPEGEGIGLVHKSDLTNIVDAYTDAGVFETAPSIDGTYDEATIAGVYDESGQVIWPAG